jgi:DNA modification methylase
VQVDIRPIKDIKTAKYNPRKISDQALESLKQSIERFGFVDPVIVNDRTGVLVGWHQRVKAAKELGLEAVPVVGVNLDDGEEKALNVALNKISGEWDLDLLRGVLEDVQAAGLDLSLTGFTEDEWLAMSGEDVPFEGLTDADEVPDLPEEADTVTRPGDLWILGEHRLLCGDSTKAEDVERLLNNDKPFIMVTDPPYGVNYDPKWRLDAGLNKAHQKRAEGKVLNDDNASWKKAWDLFPGTVAYVWHGALHSTTVALDLIESNFDLRAQIIWVKPSLVIGRGAYHWKHEPCWYGSRGTAKWTGDRKQSTAWEIANMHRTQGSVDDGKTIHGTQKPVECMLRPIRNHGDKSDAVYDPFLGSGTTLIASEQIGRRCYGLEINPQYCDVIIKRWEQFTGKKAVRG